MLNDLLYVLSGRYEQSVHYAREMDVPRDRLKHIVRQDSLRDINGSGKILYVYGTAEDRRDYEECLLLAKERGFEIRHV